MLSSIQRIRAIGLYAMGFGTEKNYDLNKINVPPVGASGYSLGPVQFDFGQRGNWTVGYTSRRRNEVDENGAVVPSYSEDLVGRVNLYATLNNKTNLPDNAVDILNTKKVYLQARGNGRFTTDQEALISDWLNTKEGTDWRIANIDKSGGVYATVDDSRTIKAVNSELFNGWDIEDQNIAAAIVLKSVHQGGSGTQVSDFFSNPANANANLKDFESYVQNIETKRANLIVQKNTERQALIDAGDEVAAGKVLIPARLDYLKAGEKAKLFNAMEDSEFFSQRIEDALNGDANSTELLRVMFRGNQTKAIACANAFDDNEAGEVTRLSRPVWQVGDSASREFIICNPVNGTASFVRPDGSGALWQDDGSILNLPPNAAAVRTISGLAPVSFVESNSFAGLGAGTAFIDDRVEGTVLSFSNGYDYLIGADGVAIRVLIKDDLAATLIPIGTSNQYDANGNLTQVDENGFLVQSNRLNRAAKWAANSDVVSNNDDTYLSPSFDSDNDGILDFGDVDGVALNNISDEIPVTAITSQQGIAVLNNVASFITAIQGGKPLPIATTGFNLLNTVTTGSVPVIANVSTVFNGLTSLYNLSNALQNGDTLTRINASLNTLNYVNSTLPTLLNAGPLSYGLNTVLNGSGTVYNAAADGLVSSGNFNGILNGGTPGVIPVLGLILSIRSGDPIGIISGLIGILNPALLATPPVGWILAGASILRALFGNKAPPEAWGTGKFILDANGNIAIDVVGESFGRERVSQQLGLTQQILSGLMAQALAASPGTPLGLIAQRTPILTWREARQSDKGYAIVDIDPVTGTQRYPYLRFDDNGVPFSSNPAVWQPDPLDEGIRISMTEQLLNSALRRQAIAPQWEVDTANYYIFNSCLRTIDGRSGRIGLSKTAKHVSYSKPAEPVTNAKAIKPVKPACVQVAASGVCTASHLWYPTMSAQRERLTQLRLHKLV